MKDKEQGFLSSEKGQKMILMGFDGAMPYFVKRFSKEGKTPNTARLIKNGFFADAYSTPPCDTPTNWATIATGADTGVHGVTSFYIHIPGEPLDYGAQDEQRGRGQLSTYCNAEYLWDTADRAGKKCLIINYRGGWPTNMKNGIVINGDGKPVHYIGTSMRYVTPQFMRDEEQLCSVKFEKINNFEGNIKSYSSILRSEIRVESPYIEGGLTLKILIIDSEGKGYDRVFIGRLEDCCEEKQFLKIGGWTDWFEEEFKLLPGKKGKSTIYYIQVKPDSPNIKGFFRFMLKRLSPDGSEFQLFRTHIFTTLGWTYPAELGPELLKNLDLGKDFYPRVDKPLVDGALYWSVDEGREAGESLSKIDEDRMQANRLIKIIEYIQKTYGWDMCFFHFHLMDRINHHILGNLCPENPDYTESESKKSLQLYEIAYKLIDDFVGELMKRYLKKNTLFVYVSDHAAVPTWKYVRIAPALIKAGLLTYNWDQNTQKFMVDWSKTKAFPYIYPSYIWVNLKGRDPEGIVEPEEYNQVREKIIKSLMEIRDPETGECPIALALKKEDATFLFQYGERVGDVIYYLKPPYSMDGPSPKSLYYYLHQSAVEPELFGKGEVGPTTMLGDHPFYLPAARFDSFSVSPILIISGPGVRKGCEADKPVLLRDIAPTVAKLLGIPSPSQADGRVLDEALES